MFLNKRSVGFESRQGSCCMWILEHHLPGFKFLDVHFCPPLHPVLLQTASSMGGQMTFFHQLEFAH